MGCVFGPEDLAALPELFIQPQSSGSPLLLLTTFHQPPSHSLYLFISASFPLSAIVALNLFSSLLPYSLTPSIAQWLLPVQLGVPRSEDGISQELECELRQPGASSRCCAYPSNRKTIDIAVSHQQLFICQTVGASN